MDNSNDLWVRCLQSRGCNLIVEHQDGGQAMTLTRPWFDYYCALMLPCVSQARVWRCLLLNGCLFLGCILWWTLALAPAVDWLASRFISPCWGPRRADAVAAAMRLIFDALPLSTPNDSCF